MVDVTHDELVTRAVAWMMGKSGRCMFAWPEVGTTRHFGEISDAFGMRWDGTSVVIECKTSRADFLADRRKRARLLNEDGDGLGALRYYMIPKDLDIDEAEVPDPWGLLHVTPMTTRVVHSARLVELTATGLERERAVMLGAIADIQRGARDRQGRTKARRIRERSGRPTDQVIRGTRRQDQAVRQTLRRTSNWP